MPDLLASWAEELARIPAAPGVTLELTYPLKSRSDALCSLLSEALSLTDGAAVREPFSDILLLIDGQPPFATEALNGCCRVTLGVRTCYALPPLSAALCRQLMDGAQADEAVAPRLDGESRTGEFVACADSRSARVAAGRRLEMLAAPFKLKVVKMPWHQFGGVLREKLMWGEDLRNKENERC